MQATQPRGTTAILQVYFGPMGSGKTTRALEQVSQFIALGFTTAYITSKLEEGRAEQDHVFYSHNKSGAQLKQECTTLRCTILPEIPPLTAEVVVIDEAQFFSNLVPAVKGYISQGKRVQVYGLASDFKGDKFGSIVDLISFADVAVQMTAKCARCSSESRTIVPASFTDRNGDKNEVISVGGMAEYTPVCRYHHSRLN